MFTLSDKGIMPGSYAYASIPSEFNKRLNICVDCHGYFNCGGAYSARRVGYDSRLFMYTVGGRGLVRYGGHEVPLAENSLLLLDCRLPADYRAAGDSGWQFYWVHAGGLCADSVVGTVSGEPLSVTSVPDKGDVMRLMQSITDLKEITLLPQMLLGSKLLTELVLAAAAERERERKKSERVGFDLTHTLELIGSRYGEDLKLEELSEDAVVSKYHFLRLFKQATGTTPIEYITSYRIRASMVLLKTTKESIEDIAHAVGYENVSAFIRAFTARSGGLTPLQYRKS